MLEFYLVLYVLSALCLLGSAFGFSVKADLTALGLLFFVAVPLIQTVQVLT